MLDFIQFLLEKECTVHGKNAFIQLIHDGCTLVNGKHYQALGIQFVSSINLNELLEQVLNGLGIEELAEMEGNTPELEEPGFEDDMDLDFEVA